MSNYEKPLNLDLKRGALHKTLGISPTKKIPESDLEQALGSRDPLTRKRAQFAENASQWNHGK